MELIVELLNVILVLSVFSMIGVVSCMVHQFILHRRIDEVSDTLKEHYDAFVKNRDVHREFLDLHKRGIESNLALHELSGKRIDDLQELIEAEGAENAKP